MRLLVIRLETWVGPQTKGKTRYLLHKYKLKRMFSWAISRTRSVLPDSFWHMVLYTVSYICAKFRVNIRRIGSNLPWIRENVWKSLVFELNQQRATLVLLEYQNIHCFLHGPEVSCQGAPNWLQLARNSRKCTKNDKKIACFCKISPEPAACRLIPSGISKSTLLHTWAWSFVAKVAKLAPACQGSAKKCEKWPKIGRCLVNHKCTTLVLSAYQTRQYYIPASKISWADSKNWLQYSHWSFYKLLAQSLYCDYI